MFLWPTDSRPRKPATCFVWLLAACSPWLLPGCGQAHDTDDQAPVPTQQRFLPGHALGRMRSALSPSQPEDRQRFRSVGALMWRSDDGHVHESCSGVRIAADAVLTAAHCVVEMDSEDALMDQLLFVQAARPLPLGANTPRQVRAVVRHPSFRGLRVWPKDSLLQREPQTIEEIAAVMELARRCGAHAGPFAQQPYLRCVTEQSAELQRALGIGDADMRVDDLAVLFLQPEAQPAAQVPTARLGDVADAAGQLVAVGYGFAPPIDGPRLLDLFFGQLQRRSSVVQLDFAGSHAVQLQGSSLLCDGDSGGGLFAQQFDGSWTLVGIASRSGNDPQTPLCGQDAIYTRIAPYKAWLDTVLQNACDNGLRAAKNCGAQAPSAVAPGAADGA